MKNHMLTKAKQMKSSLQHEEVDLAMCTDVIDYQQSVCLNAHGQYLNLAGILQANPQDKFLLSDVDQQLLLKIVFKEPVALSQLMFRANVGPSDADPEDTQDSSGPKDVRLFANNEGMDFSEAEDSACAHRLDLEPETLQEGGKAVLPGAKFHRIRSIQMFVADNQKGSAFTFINRVGLIGHVSESYHS
uniref:PITH domain-containing protein n=1 Tax=Chromera velia CCMP2878 TaxID=1169474 RepID=A0A0G4HAC1_9ALVE|eukprot:Cvel_6079.t1-p1 / transcript=Cvel_6079.t1 / gene=Cvel_6079 / organism=Chromera_velia_CCMP2878 / gene_product=PITH domain-containing protein At3g04780, putative / transcript_product=PITH domain-containing protein At3g04780, putative / location=Cvel_scaffold292:87410-89426(-) / protein_length=188 / sequence_SO=supercontig / SO=protein_coding / is_pseudo=false